MPYYIAGNCFTGNKPNQTKPGPASHEKRIFLQLGQTGYFRAKMMINPCHLKSLLFLSTGFLLHFFVI